MEKIACRPSVTSTVSMLFRQPAQYKAYTGGVCRRCNSRSRVSNFKDKVNPYIFPSQSLGIEMKKV